MKRIAVKLKSSVSGCTISQRLTLNALKLNKINKTILLNDNKANRGQLLKIQHLVVIRLETV